MPGTWPPGRRGGTERGRRRAGSPSSRSGRRPRAGGGRRARRGRRSRSAAPPRTRPGGHRARRGRASAPAHRAAAGVDRPDARATKGTEIPLTPVLASTCVALAPGSDARTAGSELDLVGVDQAVLPDHRAVRVAEVGGVAGEALPLLDGHPPIGVRARAHGRDHVGGGIEDADPRRLVRRAAVALDRQRRVNTVSQPRSVGIVGSRRWSRAMTVRLAPTRSANPPASRAPAGPRPDPGRAGPRPAR